MSSLGFSVSPYFQQLRNRQLLKVYSMLNIELRNRERNHLHAEEVYNLVFEIRATQMKEFVHKTIIIISIASIYHVFTSERDCSKRFACLLSFYSNNCLIRQVLESSPSHKRTLQ